MDRKKHTPRNQFTFEGSRLQGAAPKTLWWSLGTSNSSRPLPAVQGGGYVGQSGLLLANGEDLGQVAMIPAGAQAFALDAAF
jgi:hypothetical protein